MRWKIPFLSAVCYLFLASTVLYTACEQDPCTSLNCQNKGACVDGLCRCPNGFEGSQCESRASDRFVGRYLGSIKCDSLPSLIDTLTIFLRQAPATLGLTHTQRNSANQRDTFYGTISGDRIIVPDVDSANTKRYVGLTLDGRKATMFVEHVTDVANRRKTVCLFVGNKP